MVLELFAAVSDPTKIPLSLLPNKAFFGEGLRKSLIYKALSLSSLSIVKNIKTNFV